MLSLSILKINQHILSIYLVTLHPLDHSSKKVKLCAISNSTIEYLIPHTLTDTGCRSPMQLISGSVRI